MIPLRLGTRVCDELGRARAAFSLREAAPTPRSKRMVPVVRLRIGLPVDAIATWNIREEAVELRLDHCVALANRLFQARPIKHLDAATAVADESGPLQISGSLGNPFAAHPEHDDRAPEHHRCERGSLSEDHVRD